MAFPCASALAVLAHRQARPTDSVGGGAHSRYWPAGLFASLAESTGLASLADVTTPVWWAMADSFKTARRAADLLGP